MNTNKLIFIFFLLLDINTKAQQTLLEAANNAYLITSMAEKHHIKPRNIDNIFSNDVFNTILKKLERDKIYFTNEDIKRLEIFRNDIHEEIKNKKSNFLSEIISIYPLRLKQTDTLIKNILNKPFNFTLPEKYTVAEDTSYPDNLVATNKKLYKKLKYLLGITLAKYAKYNPELLTTKGKLDSIETNLRHQLLDIYSRNIQRELEFPGGIQLLLANDYCKAIASCYDPHSSYMSLNDKEDFEGSIGAGKMVFGFNLDEDENGDVIIKKLLPGGNAFKNGTINQGDKIIAVQWEGSKPIDVSHATVDEINAILSEENHKKITLTILKKDGTKRQAELVKEMQSAENDDESKVKSCLLKGSKTIGYISLPSFYTDFEAKSKISGCSNDIAKEILKLKEEKIEGLVIDLRYNGGGSVQEAVELAGLFIDAGPVAQIKTKESKVITLKDINRGTIYDGPLVLLVNGLSASASELLAGALQDYHRALIVGSTTYGKATGQTIYPLDTSYNINDEIDTKRYEAYIKLTISQVYQVSGNTAQFQGIIPDITVPDASEAFNEKEQNEPFAIPANKIDANKYYLPNSLLPISSLKEKAEMYIKEDSSFFEIKKFIAEKTNKSKAVDKPLQLTELIKLIPDLGKEDVNDTTKNPSNKYFTIATHKYQTLRIKADSDLKENIESFNGLLLNDPTLTVAFRLILLM